MKEVEEKVAKGQAKIFSWEHLKEHLPPNLKISPIAMIPHKSRSWRAIIDLSFALKFNMGISRMPIEDRPKLDDGAIGSSGGQRPPTNHHWYLMQGTNT